MHRFLKLTASNDFYILTAGILVSGLGSYMTVFGLSVWVFQETGSPTAFATLLFFAIVPSALGSLFAGPFVDRMNRREVMIFSDIAAAVSTMAVLLLFYTGNLLQWHLYVAFTISGIANSFFFPAFEASIPILVPKDRLGNAIGIVQSGSAIIPIISAPLAGVLISQLGLGVIFAIDLATFLVAIWALFTVSIPNPARVTNDQRNSLIDDFIFGVRYVSHRPSLLYLMGLATLFVFLNGILAALFGPLVMSFADAQAFGIAYAAFGTGALCSGMILTLTGGPKRRMQGILAGIFVASVGAIMAGAWAKTSTVSAGIFFYSAGYMFLNGLYRVILQMRVTNAVLGRIFALSAVLSLGAQAISTLLAGPLATELFEPLLTVDGPLATSVGLVIGVGAGRGIGFMYIVVGVFLLIVAICATLMPQIRSVEDTLPEPEDGPA